MFSGRNRICCIWWNVVTGKMHLQSIVTYTYLNVPFGNVFSEVQMQAISVNTVFCSAMAVVSKKYFSRNYEPIVLRQRSMNYWKTVRKAGLASACTLNGKKNVVRKQATFQVSLWFEIVFPFHKHLPLYSFDLAIPTLQSTLDMSGFVASSCLLRQIKLSRMF